MYNDNREKKYRVLLVEDNQFTADEERYYLEEHIKENNIKLLEVEIAVSVKDALNVFESAAAEDAPFDIVIIDLILRHNDTDSRNGGLDLLKKITKSPVAPYPIIRSALHYNQMYKYFTTLGIWGYVEKTGNMSWELRELKKRVEDLIEIINVKNNKNNTEKTKNIHYKNLSYISNQWMNNGKLVTDFTRGDSLLLKFFVQNQGIVLSQEKLFEYLEGENATNRLDDNKETSIEKRISERIRHLRLVLTNLGYDGKKIIISKRNQGYYIESEKNL